MEKKQLSTPLPKWLAGNSLCYKTPATRDHFVIQIFLNFYDSVNERRLQPFPVAIIIIIYFIILICRVKMLMMLFKHFHLFNSFMRFGFFFALLFVGLFVPLCRTGNIINLNFFSLHKITEILF